jgi:hypothetical protein
MTAQELRLNNLLFDYSGQMRRVAYVGETIGLHNDIGGTDKYQRNPLFSYDINTLKPIPLVPEILERCGFKNYGGWIGKKIAVDFWDEQTEIVFEFIDSNLTVYGNDIRIRKIENTAVHQLQNLFYSLTGEELQIEL